MPNSFFGKVWFNKKQGLGTLYINWNMWNLDKLKIRLDNRDKKIFIIKYVSEIQMK